MKIYGAGLAGLLAGSVLRRFEPTIYEAQDELPNNHAALLRFRSEIASTVTQIPFKKVLVRKMIAHAGRLYTEPNLKLSNLYSQKVTKAVMPRSIASLEPVERFIAPSDFIAQVSKGLKIECGQPLTKEILAKLSPESPPTISTVPMPVMMKLTDWSHLPDFKYSTIWSVWGEFESPEIEIYDTVYYPDYTDPYYRVSITGSTFVMEFIEEPPSSEIDLLTEASMVLAREFGVTDVRFKDVLSVKKQEYGKLLPIDNAIRKEFILFLTDRYGIYSLGRFATWRQLLLDDIAVDCKKIESMIEYRNHYKRRLINVGA